MRKNIAENNGKQGITHKKSKYKKAGNQTYKKLCTRHIKNGYNMQICNKQKYCNTNLVIVSVKKQIVTQGKRQTRNINACKKQLSTQT